MLNMKGNAYEMKSHKISEQSQNVFVMFLGMAARRRENYCPIQDDGSKIVC